jgi:hypothetical protein
MKIYLPSLLFLVFCFQYTHAATWHVGPTRTYQYCSQVAPLVQNGDTVLIDYATYINDPQVKWTKNNLLLKGIGGRPTLQAGNIIASDAVNGKGIFVISGANVTVENIEFAQAAVMDHNGAGIRQEGANLVVRYCKFTSNEMGILCGNIANCKTVVEYSEFINGGSTLNPGYQHNIYINHIDTLVFRYNFTHDAIAEGHELKSRANYNFILYNRISNEQSVDSRTIDLPNGGTSVIVGNIIEQGPNSANSNLLGYGLEGLSNPAPHNLWICNNTFINKKTTGSFINIATGTDTLFLKNNILAGAKTGGLILGAAIVLDSSYNIVDNNIAPLGFINANQYDYHLLPNSPAVNAGIPINKTIYGYALQPNRVYKDTCDVEIRNNENTIDIGAFEYQHPLSVPNISAGRLNVFPNPSSGLLHIETMGEDIRRIKIYDLNGALLREHFTADFSIADLADGVYVLAVETDEMIYSGKVVKQ